MSQQVQDNKHVYELNQQRIETILSWVLRCQKCGRKLQLGEMIFSKKSSTHRTNYWCLKCAIETGQYEP